MGILRKFYSLKIPVAATTNKRNCLGHNGFLPMANRVKVLRDNELEIVNNVKENLRR